MLYASSSEMERIGLIAGNGNFPLLFAKAARRRGDKIVAVAIKEETSKRLVKYVDTIHWIGVGELNKLFQIFRKGKINRAIMAGQIRPSFLFNNISMDREFKILLESVKDKKADSLLGAVAKRLGEMGITLINSTTYLLDFLPSEGVLTSRSPTSKEWQDIQFGKKVAKQIAGIDIGQTVVVKDKAVLAIEAMEGTDETILRGGKLGNGYAVVVKVSKPRQDMRFDIPVVGPRTIDSLVTSRAKVLAIEAKKTLLIDKGRCIKKANSHGIAIVAI